MLRYFFGASLLLLGLSCQWTQQPIDLQNGLVITKSVKISPDTFYLNGQDSLDRPVLTIQGNNIVVDFNGSVLVGSSDKETPDEFYGLGIRVENGENITIKNASVRGFKVGLMAESVDSLKIVNSDFSYNYRQRLKSIREREDLSDWMSYHNNEKDEWLRYGAAIYLKSCDHALLRNVRVTGGQNGLMLMQCNRGLFYNNTFHFNSGIGIGMYRSSRNRVLHNRLDWNVRGYSHGFYERGQDSAAILVYEQSNENVFAYNSATHSGDGFFLWAGQTTMDSGEGGCNDNILYGNDFSYAPTNGVEVTFSRNVIANNILNDCKYGVWGGYSFETVIVGNEMHNNRYGVAIEHGQQNQIVANDFVNDEIGIQLFERPNQPADWGYAQARDVSSRDYRIARNQFVEVTIPLKIDNSAQFDIIENGFFDYSTLMTAEGETESLIFEENRIAERRRLGAADIYFDAKSFTTGQAPDSIALAKAARDFYVEPLPDGMDVMLSDNQLRGKQYILVDEWGPYDFRYPSIWLRKIEGNTYTLLLLGPQGNWKVTGAEGWTKLGPKTGTFPATIVAEKDPNADEVQLNLEFIGEALTDQFGNAYERGAPFPFEFYRYQKDFNWQVHWHEWTDETHPLDKYEAFRQLKNRPAPKRERTNDLAYTFWDSPGADIDANRFATFASSNFEITPGRYQISVTSDDGVKVFLDGEAIIDHWDIHVPATDEVEVELGGEHTLEIEHFEGGGFSTLSFRFQPVREVLQ